jgi:hypothetical protein
MLMIERTIRHAYAHVLGPDTKMPRKGQAVYLSSPYFPHGVGIWWTDRKSPEGRRLFNVGRVRADGEQPPLFAD